MPRSRLNWIVFAAGLLGGGAAYFLQWWFNVVDYPLNIGGRPYHSALAFMPITFEMTVLSRRLRGADPRRSCSAGYRALWQPVFEVDGFERATIDRFWLGVATGDRALDRSRDTLALERRRRAARRVAGRSRVKASAAPRRPGCLRNGGSTPDWSRMITSPSSCRSARPRCASHRSARSHATGTRWRPRPRPSRSRSRARCSSAAASGSRSRAPRATACTATATARSRTTCSCADRRRSRSRGSSR